MLTTYGFEVSLVSLLLSVRNFGRCVVCLNHGLPAGCFPKHLMWTLLFITLYSKEYQLAIMVRDVEKTIRKWVWIMDYNLCTRCKSRPLCKLTVDAVSVLLLY
jgi:hypothetical protein